MERKIIESELFHLEKAFKIIKFNHLPETIMAIFTLWHKGTSFLTIEKHRCCFVYFCESWDDERAIRVNVVMAKGVHSSLKQNYSVCTLTCRLSLRKASDSAQQWPDKSRGETLDYHKYCGTGRCEYGCKENHCFK